MNRRCFCCQLSHIRRGNFCFCKHVLFTCVTGTGTQVGDPTEVNAFASFFNCFDGVSSNSVHVKSGQKILIGSVKTNIGHTESAAAMAGLIKVLLMMKHGKVVRSLFINEDMSNLNRKINIENTALHIAVTQEDWPPNQSGCRLACVNSFGFGGSNGHVIVQQIPGVISDKDKTECSLHFVCISGRDKDALLENITNFMNDLDCFHINICDISHTSIFARDHFERRILLFGKTIEDIKESAEGKRKALDTISFNKKLNIIMVFCGVGTTWTGMGSELIKTQPVFRQMVQKIDAHLQLFSNINIEEKLTAQADLSDPFLNHIAIFTVQVALFELWKSLGVLPKVIIGQSVGEVAAAYASGALDLHSAVKVIYHRSNILSRQIGGKMTVVGNVSLKETEKVCFKYSGSLNIAVYNSPSSCTLSGTSTAIEAIEKETNAIDGSFVRSLKVKCAYHSHLMDNCLKELSSALKGIQIGNGKRISQISTVTGEETTLHDLTSGDYWANNVRQPVLFMQAIKRAVKSNETNVYIEIGPRQVLKLHLPNIIDVNIKSLCLPSMNPSISDCFYMSLTTLYEMGVDVKFRRAMSCTGNLSKLPRYHFRKSTSLFMPVLANQYLAGLIKSVADQRFIQQTSHKDFTVTLNNETTPFVFEHRLFGSVTIPGATYIEAAVQSACRMLDVHYNDIEMSCNFENPCMIEKDRTTILSVALQANENEINHIVQYKVQQDKRTLCSGSIRKHKLREYHDIDVISMRRRLSQTLTSDEIYTAMEKIGLKYGDSLRVIKESYSNTSSCLSVIKLHKSVTHSLKNFCIHPVVIDAMFQTSSLLTNTLGTSNTGGIPKGFGLLKVFSGFQDTMLIVTKRVRVTRMSSFYNVFLCSYHGNVIAEIRDLEMRNPKTSFPNDNISYELKWRQHDNTQSINDEKEYKNESVIVFGSRKFISWMSQSKYILKAPKLEIPEKFGLSTDDVRKALIGYKDILKIIYAPCYSLDIVQKKNTTQVYDMVRTNLLSLQALFKMKKSLLNENVVIFVVTDKTQRLSQENHANSNFLGAELWGFARSAMTENPYEDIRLVDVDLGEGNADAFFDVVVNEEKRISEAIIRNGSVYIPTIEVSSTQEIDFIQRNLRESTECLSLLSKSHTAIISPFLTPCSYHLQHQKKKKTVNVKENVMNILVSNVHVKKSKMSQTIPQLLPTITIDPETPAVPVNAPEFFGWAISDTDNICEVDTSSLYGVCFPIQVLTVVAVPRCCVFSLQDIPFYRPGLLSEVLPLMQICMHVKSKSNVLIAVCDKNSWKAKLLQSILNFQNSTGEITTWTDVHSTDLKRKGFNHAVVFDMENARNLDKLEMLEDMRRIITTDSCLAEHYIENHHTRYSSKMIVLRIEKVYEENNLVRLVPKVLKYLKSNIKEIGTLLQEEVFPTDFNYHSVNMFHAPGQTSLPVLQYPSNLFKQDACYLFVGGTSGLGWELLQYCAEIGARNLITLSRRNLSSGKIALMKTVEKAFDCRIRHIQGDVTDLESMKSIFTDFKQRKMNVKGIFHGGAVLKDTPLENMSKEELEEALLPKVLGTLNLHEASKDFNLDFFLMHSSVAAVFGNPGQCNYAAGNSFQDAFAHFRTSCGYSAQSINWGALTMGMSTDSNVDLKSRFQRQGIYFLNTNDVRTSLNEIILTNKAQNIFGIFDWQRFLSNPSFSPTKSKFQSLVDFSQIRTQADSSTSSEMLALPSDFKELTIRAQKEIFLNIIFKTLKASLLLEDAIGLDTSLYQLGIDSLSAMSISNTIFQVTQVRIPVVVLLSNSASIEVVLDFLSREFGSNDEPESGPKEMSVDFDILNSPVTFMQASILNCLQDEDSATFIRSINYEFCGKRTLVSDWKKILTCLLNMHHGLRQTFRWNIEAASYEVVEEDISDINLPVDVMPFESIFEESGMPKLDPRFDLPIRFYVSCDKKTTRLKVFLHTIIVDMRAIEILFRDLELCIKHHFLKDPLPRENHINIAEKLQHVLLPNFGGMKRFWKQVFSNDIRRLSFVSPVIETLDKRKWMEMGILFGDSKFDEISNFVQREKLTIYNFILSVYFMLIHDITGSKIVPLVTNSSIRGFVPALENVLTRCINEIPVVGFVDPSLSSKNHLKENSLRLNAFTENGAYPFQLIKEEMQSEELRKYIGRNRFVVDNISTLSQDRSNEGITVKVSSVHHRRHTYETSLFLYQDMKKKVLLLELGFNTGAVTEAVARSILNRFEYLVFRLVSADSEITVRDLLDESAKAEYEKNDSKTNICFNTLFEIEHVNHISQSDENSVENLNSLVKGIEQQTDFSSGLQEIMRGAYSIYCTELYYTFFLHVIQIYKIYLASNYIINGTLIDVICQSYSFTYIDLYQSSVLCLSNK